MTDYVKTTIKLPNSIREKVEKLAQGKGISQEAIILQLLEFALSQGHQKRIVKGKLPPDLKNGDC